MDCFAVVTALGQAFCIVGISLQRTIIVAKLLPQHTTVVIRISIRLSVYCLLLSDTVSFLSPSLASGYLLGIAMELGHPVAFLTFCCSRKSVLLEGWSFSSRDRPWSLDIPCRWAHALYEGSGQWISSSTTSYEEVFMLMLMLMLMLFYKDYLQRQQLHKQYGLELLLCALCTEAYRDLL